MGKPAELSDPGGRSIAQRALIVPYYLNEYYGWPALVLAGIGAGALARRRDTLTLVVWAWVAGTFAFLLLGVFTPLDFRHYLAAFPAIAHPRRLRRGALVDEGSVPAGRRDRPDRQFRADWRPPLARGPSIAGVDSTYDFR